MKLFIYGIAGVLALRAPKGTDATQPFTDPAVSAFAVDSTRGTSQLADADAARVVDVSIDNFRFAPAMLTVPVGTTVKWTNHDDVPHTATSKDEPSAFDSRALDTDASYSFTFTRPGTYRYYCKVHTHMTATLIVK
jgi:plastocyanin